MSGGGGGLLAGIVREGEMAEILFGGNVREE